MKLTPDGQRRMGEGIGGVEKECEQEAREQAAQQLAHRLANFYSRSARLRVWGVGVALAK